MKLFVFNPSGHNQFSFMVMAESEEQARETVDKYVKEKYLLDSQLDYAAYGWPEEYTVSVGEPGQVLEHDNE